jgi:hypothetical protein
VAGSTRFKGVCLVNPLESRAAVSYVLNEEVFTLRPGEVHQLQADEYGIEFDKGGELGTASFDLEERTYAFRVSKEKGWELKVKNYKVTLDNRTNPNAFNYVKNGKTDSVPAGQMQEVVSKYPLLVSFDPGDGGEPARRWLTEGTYKVGVDGRAKLLELFRNAVVSKPAASSEPSMIGR